MKNNWDQKIIATAYSVAIGEYGDFWRQALVNPVVLSYAKSLSVSLSQGSLIDRISCHEGIAEQRATFKNRASIEELIKWHQDQQQQGSEKQWLTISNSKTGGTRPLRVLDLGCGEGYLGRWVSSMGAHYWGVDSSEQLLSVATEKSCSKNKAKNSIHAPSFINCDLDGVSFDSSRKAYLTQQIETPDLVVLTIMLDHLDNPIPLMSWLRELLSNNHIDSRILIFGLNIDYFFDPDPGKTKTEIDGSQGRVIRMNATIDSAQQEVEIRLRPTDTMERIFRDSGFRIVQYNQLNFTPGMRPQDMASFVSGIPPFDLFLLAPYPQPVASEEKEEIGNALLSGELPSPLNNLSAQEKEQFKTFLCECEMFDLQRKETLLQQHNIGGDVFVVLEGSLDLIGLTPVWGNDSLKDFDGKPIADREIVLRTFKIGELIGELETAAIGEESYFIYPVRAGDNGARVLRIPHRHISSVIDAKIFTADLFKSLQKRILHLNLMHIPHGREKKWKGETGRKFPMFPWWCRGAVTPLNVARVASGLLSLAEIERQTTKRDSSGRSFLADISNTIFHKTGVGVGAIQEILRILIGVGAIDAFALADLRQHFRREWKEGSHSILVYAVSNILYPKWAWSGWETIENQITKHECFENGLNITKDKGQDLTEQARNHIRDLLRHHPGNNEWENAIARYRSFIWTAGVWWTSLSPMYFRLNDLTVLKRLIYNDEREIDYELYQRLCSTTWWSLGQHKPCPPFKQFVDDSTGFHAGRISRYLHHAIDFIQKDVVSNDSRLNFSGQETGARPPTLP